MICWFKYKFIELEKRESYFGSNDSLIQILINWMNLFHGSNDSLIQTKKREVTFWKREEWILVLIQKIHWFKHWPFERNYTESWFLFKNSLIWILTLWKKVEWNFILTQAIHWFKCWPVKNRRVNLGFDSKDSLIQTLTCWKREVWITALIKRHQDCTGAWTRSRMFSLQFRFAIAKLSAANEVQACQ